MGSKEVMDPFMIMVFEKKNYKESKCTFIIKA